MSGEEVVESETCNAVKACDTNEAMDKRQVAAYRRFQATSLRALTNINKLLMGKTPLDKSSVKVGDIKSLVSAYREAAQAERAVMGMNGGQESAPRTGEMVVRWVDDDDPMMAGYGDV